MMSRDKNLLLIIDMQYDFCMPDGALYVNGADEDCKRLAGFIVHNEDKIDHIVFTEDNHHVLDISHPAFWADQRGNHPSPFTPVKSQDVVTGKWKPLYFTEMAVHYIENLEKQGEFPHTIWPEHCIIGSKGAALADDVLDPVKDWARKGHFYERIIKGTNPLTEHFGALRANIPLDDAPETLLNRKLLDTLLNYRQIIIAGEARSHCVANTVKQMLEIDELPEKTILLWDCMSNVTGFEKIADPIYKEAMRRGVKISHSGLVNLE